MPVGEIIQTLNAEIARGRLRYIAASNWPVRRIQEANEFAKAHGLAGFVASQPQWNLAHPNGDPPTVEPSCKFLLAADVVWHASAKLPVIPYSSTAGGYFATDGQSNAGNFDNPVSRARLGRAKELAAQLGRTPNQIALAYLMNQEFPVIPIIGTTDVEHMKDAFGAVDVKLTGQQVRWLRDG